MTGPSSDDEIVDAAIEQGFIDPRDTLDPTGTAYASQETTCAPHGEPYGRCPVCDGYPGDDDEGRP